MDVGEVTFKAGLMMTALTIVVCVKTVASVERVASVEIDENVGAKRCQQIQDKHRGKHPAL